MKGQLTTAPAIITALMAGKSTLTLVSLTSGSRYTFKFVRPEEEAPDRCVWIRLLTGSDNEDHFTFLGTFFPRTATFKARGNSEALAWRTAQWLITKIQTAPDVVLSQAEVWHEGTCCRCGRKLTVPSSIASGIGPECSKHLS